MNNNGLHLEKWGVSLLCFPRFAKKMQTMSLWLAALLVVFLTVAGQAQAAAPTFQAAGVAVSGTGSVNPAWPTHQFGDLALLFVESAGGEPATLSTPAGFVAVANSPQATGATTNGARITVFWARATSTAMATPRVADAGDHVYAQILTYRGVVNVGNPWDVTGGGVKAAASGTVTVSGVTTTGPETLIVQAVARDDDSAAAEFSAQTNGSLVGLTGRSDAGTTSGNGGGFAVWDGTMNAAGATGNTTANVTSSINAFLTIALKPFCTAPSNVPVGVVVSCVCDTFGRATLNPSTIFGSAAWVPSSSDGLNNDPYINVTSGLLRLTENTGNNAKAATVPAIFPASGNYISVEFQAYAYNGNGADGIAVTLSDSSIPAVPGAFGGSLGYAQQTSIPGFAGGWLGVALDEFGNYQNPTEGRVNGPGFIVQSVGVRGPGKATNGYRWLGGTASNPGGLGIDNTGSATPAPGYMYQVVVDARNAVGGTINVNVNRDATTKNGNSYVSLFGPFNAYTEANFALTQGWTTKVVPDYWKISFTGSTGGQNNIHEIGGLRVCAQSIAPPTGGVASGFSAIDEAFPIAAGSTVPAYPNFQTGDIYMKLAGTPFKLWVAALTATGISDSYSAVSNKFLSVKIVDNSDGLCGPDTARTCNGACTGKAAVEAGGTQILQYISSDKGAKLSPSYTLNSAWNNLIAVIKECTSVTCATFTATAPACSADSFSVRPLTVAVSSTSASGGIAATNGATTGTPAIKAGSNFNLTATTISGYTGALRINAASLVSPAIWPGSLNVGSFPAAVAGVASSNTFTYGEVGAFNFLAPTGGVPIPGVYDDTWTLIDSVSTKNDCVSGVVAAAYSNTINASGKYGCNFGISANTASFGRFTPDHFSLSSASIVNRSDMGAGTGCTPASTFTYMGEPMKAWFTLQAQNAAGGITKNYAGTLAKLDLNTPANLNLGALDSFSSSLTRTITQITKANPGVVATASVHGYAINDQVYIGDVLGMVELNGTLQTLVAVPDTTHFSISNTSSNTTYLSGGYALKKATTGVDQTARVTPPTSSSGTWLDGVAANVSLVASFSRALDGPFLTELGIAPQDLDGVVISGYGMDIVTPVGNDHASLGLTWVRDGRIRLSNALGTELLPLSIPTKLEYFKAGTGWVVSADDSCTQVAVPTSAADLAFAAQTARNKLASGEVIARMRNAGDTADVLAPSMGTFTKGDGKLRLTGQGSAVLGPGNGNFGYVVVTIDLAFQSWFQFPWAGGAAINPSARATFGTYKSPVIYLRETY